MKTFRLLVPAIVALSGAARAEPLVDTSASVVVGGGLTGFTDGAMRQATSPGLLWTLRLTIGSRTLLGFEVDYAGAASDLDMLGVHGGTLEATTVDGLVRLGLRPHGTWNPYVFGGIGVQRYDLVGGTRSLLEPAMRTQEDSVAFPAGIGVHLRHDGLVFDARGTYRASLADGLVPRDTGGYAPMSAWEASVAAGFEL